jgi:transposase InsO family protein
MERMKVAKTYIESGHCAELVLRSCGVAKSTYFYKPKPVAARGCKGARKSDTTYKANGTVVGNLVVVQDIKSLLAQEFVDYGYLKVTYYLQDKLNYQINHKKVYRLMKECKLLNLARPKPKNKKQWVKELVPKPIAAFTYWEFDIKFIYIHHCGRYAPMLSVVDVYSRYLIGWMMQWSIKKEDVVGFFDAFLLDYEMPQEIYVRCDNGSQFESGVVREYFHSKGIIQEFTKPATPEQNAHIESYHSIIANAVCRRFEFASLANATEVFNRWEVFYNKERIHSGIGFTSPEKYLARQQVQIPIKNIRKNEKAA